MKHIILIFSIVISGCKFTEFDDYKNSRDPLFKLCHSQYINDYLKPFYDGIPETEISNIEIWRSKKEISFKTEHHHGKFKKVKFKSKESGKYDSKVMANVECRIYQRKPNEKELLTSIHRNEKLVGGHLKNHKPRRSQRNNEFSKLLDDFIANDYADVEVADRLLEATYKLDIARNK